MSSLRHILKQPVVSQAVVPAGCYRHTALSSPVQTMSLLHPCRLPPPPPPAAVVNLLGATHSSRLWFRLPVVHTGSPHFIPIMHLTRNIPISGVAVSHPKAFNDSTDLFMAAYSNQHISCVLRWLFTVHSNPLKDSGYYVCHFNINPLKTKRVCFI
jgi:hypothetical protein